MNGVVRAITVTKLPPMRPNAMLVEEEEVGPSADSSMSFCWPIGLMLLFACKRHIVYYRAGGARISKDLQINLAMHNLSQIKGGRVQHPLKGKGPLGYCY